jgi:4-oxalocrotonate tautomerase family enzyme
MPFISVKILKGFSQEKLNRLSQGVTKTVSETTGIPAKNIWLVIEQVDSQSWYVEGEPVGKPGGG